MTDLPSDDDQNKQTPVTPGVGKEREGKQEVTPITEYTRQVDLEPEVEGWLEKVESLPTVRFIPVDNRIAAYSINLPDFDHKDPADRIIIATALNTGAKLVTSDRKILNYHHVQSIW